ncbi:myosin-binding protein 2 [Rutidosis leptorrhynchoides]|uniref:myosin-binding protein 2 n=1 Tax=Rutidosis leptorrhynchoides TaxID=125765 RepID=UPI003A994A08
MAANKFATIVHKNSNRITLVLIFAVLEWTLIILLLLNSIFSYFIIKFARFFGLKPPCLWCIRLDRFFEPELKNSHRDLLCDLHSKEVSQLGFCLKHKKLAESHDMCDVCSSEFGEKSNNLSFSKETKFDFVECSCCGIEFERKTFEDSSYFVINPSWDLLGFSKSNPVIDLIGSDLENEIVGEKQEVQIQGNEAEVTEVEAIKEDLIKFDKKDDSTLNSGTHEQDLEFFLDYSGNQLVPIETFDPIDNEEQEFGDFQEAQVVSELKSETVTEEIVKQSDETVSVIERTEELSKFAGLDSMKFEETESSLVFHANLSDFTDEKPDIIESNRTMSTIEEVEETEEINSEHEEAEVSIGTEIPVLDSCDEMKAQDNFTLYYLSHEESSKSTHDLDFSLEYGFEEDEKTRELTNLNQINNPMLMIERKESMVDDSIDGSEMEGGDPINTNEKLKSALRAERKSLQALYIELEEERSASAVAASETMAMINRLQEEKAAMQMEALHYQRMMEEQSEYDQEALQLLNDLMVKKDKELEIYRKKVLEYETKERARFLGNGVKNGTCSASCSHSEDGDGMWVDVNHEPKEHETFSDNKDNKNHNTLVDSVISLDSSFVDFEDERMSILEQLKFLEEKLFTLSDEEDRYFSELRQIEDYFEENGKHVNGNYSYGSQQVNGITYETQDQDRRTGKRLLPLFEALDNEIDDVVIMSNGHENGVHSNKMENSAITLFELQKRRIDIEEEVDQLYVRLQALEADREFLKHCIGSLKKGDKGMELVQEILQHLRDLRDVDLRAKNFTDGTL